MSPIVEKWAAGFWCDRLYVVKGHFKKTAKQYRREGGSHADKMDLALSWGGRFDHDTDLLHDTQKEALDALYGREAQKRIALLHGIEKIDAQMDLINDFEISA